MAPPAPAYHSHIFTPTAHASSLLQTAPGDLDVSSGTINPASLGGGGAAPASSYSSHISGPQLPYSPPATASSEYDGGDPSKPRTVAASPPRGRKRSRSPERASEADGVNSVPGSAASKTSGDDQRPQEKRKRGRPPKPKPVPSSPSLPNHPSQPSPSLSTPSQGITTPQLSNAGLPPMTPTQQSGSLPAITKPTPPKTTTIKALPTVRDHTTDQLTPEGDEYIPREFDEAGEKKVLPTGDLLGQRTYKCRTFHVPHRGAKLFMLATECARVLGYRDSYLLFNKNRSLYKIIATQEEKDDLIQQELLPYSYRSRQIAIVTAKSMFRQFGSRVIEGGRRVRDDYWEMKARKQGFTEEDPAGEKRPGAAKQRAQQQSEQAAREAQQQQLQQQQVQPHHDGAFPHEGAPGEHPPAQMLPPGMGPPTSMSLPMISSIPPDDRLGNDKLYSVPRPRHEISGPPYEDQGKSTPKSEMSQASLYTSGYNEKLREARGSRTEHFRSSWIPPKSSPTQQHSLPPAMPPVTEHAPIHAPPMVSPRQLSNLSHQHSPPPHQTSYGYHRSGQEMRPDQMLSGGQQYPQGSYYPQGQGAAGQPSYPQPPPQPQSQHMPQSRMYSSGQMYTHGPPPSQQGQYGMPPPHQPYRPQPPPSQHPQQQQWGGWSGP